MINIFYLTILRFSFEMTFSIFLFGEGKSILSNFKYVGGQNPIEAAKLGCKIYHGPYIYNFEEIYKLLKKYGVCEMIHNENELSKKLFKDFQQTKPNENKVIAVINNLGKNILKKSLMEIDKIFKL